MKRYLHADRYVMNDREVETSWYRIRAELRAGQAGPATMFPSAAPRPALAVAAALSVCTLLLVSHMGTQRLRDGGLPAAEVTFDSTRGADAAPAPARAPAAEAEGAAESATTMRRSPAATPERPATRGAAPTAVNLAKGSAESFDVATMAAPDPLRIVESWLDSGQLPPPGTIPAADLIAAVAEPAPAEAAPAIMADTGPSPLTPGRRLLRLVFAAPADQGPAEPSETPVSRAVVIFDPQTVAWWRPLGVPLRASLRNYDPQLHDVAAGSPVTALYEIELHADAAPVAAVVDVRLTRPGVATGPVTPIETLAHERLSAELFAADGDQTSAPLALQAVAAEFARICNVGGPEVGPALADLLPQAERLTNERLTTERLINERRRNERPGAASTDDAVAQRLLAMIRRAAELTDPALPGPPASPR